VRPEGLGKLIPFPLFGDLDGKPTPQLHNLWEEYSGYAGGYGQRYPKA
jgi:hypothetical protein